MKEYTSNEPILLTVGAQWKVNNAVFTCVKKDDWKGQESYIIKVESLSHPGEIQLLRVTGKNVVKAFDLYRIYNNLNGIL